ncbi:MAG: cation diffusion facilitator family transporter [Chloroflexota bacterium]|nr:cation diffusion facilitator family transporter [Chloroflexota bacterium]
MNESEDIRGLQLTLGVYVLIFAMKLVVYLMSGVLALMAEAFHTLSDVFVASFLLVAAIYSRKKADETYMFGYGRAQNAAALVAATLFVSFTSFELYKEAIPRLFQSEPAAYQNLPWVIGVLIASMFIAAAPLVKLLRQKTRGPAAKAQFTELINDELGLLAALIGTLFIMWGQPLADPIASIVVATIIAYNGIRLFIENLSFLLGRSPGAEYLANVERIARAVPGVLGVHDLRAEFVGPGVVHAGMHVQVQRGISIEEADQIAEEVRVRVHEGEGADAGFCVIHVEPAKPAMIAAIGAAE